MAVPLIGLVILIFSAILHEVAHGFVADKLGDPTARLAGRLTLNPKKHIDPFLTILLPLALAISHLPIIGAAKPVPVDPFNLQEGKKDLALVSLAGPLTNIVIAVLGAILFRILYIPTIATALPAFFATLLFVLLKSIIDLNLLLAIFNLLPIPPLDGSKIFALILPDKEARTYLALGQFGFFILFFLLMFPIDGFSFSNFILILQSYARSLLLPSF